MHLNHSLKITVCISQINAFLREWGNIENELSFERFRIHLHHVDKRATSPYMLYHPSRGMYHVSGLVADKNIKSNGNITLSV